MCVRSRSDFSLFSERDNNDLTYARAIIVPPPPPRVYTSVFPSSAQPSVISRD